MTLAIALIATTHEGCTREQRAQTVGQKSVVDHVERRNPIRSSLGVDQRLLCQLSDHRNVQTQELADRADIDEPLGLLEVCTRRNKRCEVGENDSLLQWTHGPLRKEVEERTRLSQWVRSRCSL